LTFLKITKFITMKLLLLSLVFLIFSVTAAFSQTLVKGKLLDAQTKEPLIGATVLVKGTTTAASAALDGSFKITVPAGSQTLLISYVGYVSKEVPATSNLSVILLDPVSASLKEVVVSANPSLAIDRRTPIAVSSVGTQYIEEKGAGAEYPELIKATPGVMVTRQGGGYGDSRVNIRGFSSNNVALLINGIPVNDVENGRIFWNDWAGLSDVTTSMQVQRGLGASKVAVPSLGGTINITTKTIELEPGGSVVQSIGSYNAFKTMISYATGLSDKGWASSFLLSRSTGDGNSEGLYYTGYSYFANISKVLSKTQTLSFNIMGAAQSHGQRFTYHDINTYRNAPQGTLRYNSDYGYLNGQLFTAEQNFYNKPLASLNHNWTIDKTTSLATVVYASYGTGAAVFPNSIGNIPRTGDQYSPLDFDATYKSNANSTDGTSATYLQASENDHFQYGALSSLKKEIGDITVLGGLDLRYYEGEHFYQMNNLLGGQYIFDSANINAPGARITTGQKFNNDTKYQIVSEGVFLQTEYAKDDLSAFVTVAANNTGNRKTDYFDYLNSDPAQRTPWVNFLGYQAKGGANYNIDSHNNVFANIGFIQRPPLVATIFINKKNDINPDSKPEKLLSYELGYQFRNSVFSANVNLYRSSYKDRAKTYTGPANQDGSIPTYNISGLNELHQGIELDMKYRPVKDVTLSGMLSVNDFHYTDDTGPAQITSDKPGSTPTNVPALLLKGLKIGEFGSASTSAQTTAALGLDVNIMPKVKVGANYNYYVRYYASFDPTKVTSTAHFDTNPYVNYQVPNFSTMDLNVVYRFKFAGLDASFIGNVYNLLNTAYLADAYELNPTINQDYVTRTNALGVWYGTGRTFTTTFKIKF
jgi:iron complex outermembrane recepter protein